MDAVNYINTLDDLELSRATPTEPTFGIVDLAADAGFLRQLYGSMTQANMEWFSLFLGSSWQADWEQGPILLDLTSAPEFAGELVMMMQTKPLGVLIQSSADGAEMLQRCQRWLFNSGASILRFYEPRMLTPLIAAMTDMQRADLVRLGETWAWHNGHEWGQYQSTSENPEAGEKSPVVTTEQLKDVSWYRLAEHAREYAEYYRGNLVVHSDPQTWVMSCLMKANESGFKTKADQERWLRLAIRYGDSFYRQEAFKTVMEQQALTPAQQMTAMESNSEALNAQL
ncbi:hypothetical protein Q672_20200 [Marinobacter sp. EVN1]|uniref:DUF4123 domain-containing protein n=1 Tax=Marinobacter sp. EVN1 TaxID=1397532 RepID=UPI0003B8451D|nr:DUF4123 domain-containing protein [Marinobacter sp. EVN1]ERS82396.1 hypothetical protein Q672_20200 [Marinobacter sp. EVN1]